MIVEYKPGNGWYPNITSDGQIVVSGDGLELKAVQEKSEWPLNLSESTFYYQGQEVFLESLRADAEVVVSLYRGRSFFLNVIIPPNEYRLIDSGETDEHGEPALTKELQPINMDKLRVVVWPQKELPEN